MWVGLLCTCLFSNLLGCIWGGGVRWKHRFLAGTAEPPNWEFSEVDAPGGEAVPHNEPSPEAPRQPTAGSCKVGHGDPEHTVSGSNSRVDMLTGNKNALFVVAAIFVNVVSVTLFDIFWFYSRRSSTTNMDERWRWANPETGACSGTGKWLLRAGFTS